MGKIAILGWGSLIWDEKSNKKFDLLHEKWRKDGPSLKIEFSRISENGRLTLVIDKEHGAEVQVKWAFSTSAAVEDVVRDLGNREGTGDKHIGRWCARGKGNAARCSVAQIQSWAEGKRNEIDCVVWTALPGNFISKRKKAFSVDNAISYLESLLNQNKEKKAFEYILNAPECVQTPLRSKFNEKWGNQPA